MPVIQSLRAFRRARVESNKKNENAQEHPKSGQNKSKGTPNVDQRAAKRPPGTTKSSPEHPNAPKSARNGPGTQKIETIHPRLGPLGPPWALQGRLLVPKGFPKITQNRHDADRSAPWGAKWAKKASRRGSRNATENLTKKVSQKLRFWDAKTYQN